MLLGFTDWKPFALGAVDYLYRPAAGDISPRILIEVKIEAVYVEAILDTGSPYAICTPKDARRIGIQSDTRTERLTMVIRGVRMGGYLHRLNMTFEATQGESLTIVATVFVPDAEWEESWGETPSFIGLSGCLERMRCAIDPDTDTFYFGPLPGGSFA
jgi:hypothetical protein